jgi:hypothetical protein
MASFGVKCPLERVGRKAAVGPTCGSFTNRDVYSVTMPCVSRSELFTISQHCLWRKLTELRKVVMSAGLQSGVRIFETR